MKAKVFSWNDAVVVVSGGKTTTRSRRASRQNEKINPKPSQFRKLDTVSPSLEQDEVEVLMNTASALSLRSSKISEYEEEGVDTITQSSCSSSSSKTGEEVSLVAPLSENRTPSNSILKIKTQTESLEYVFSKVKRRQFQLFRRRTVSLCPRVTVHLHMPTFSGYGLEPLPVQQSVTMDIWRKKLSQPSVSVVILN